MEHDAIKIRVVGCLVEKQQLDVNPCDLIAGIHFKPAAQTGQFKYSGSKRK